MRVECLVHKKHKAKSEYICEVGKGRQKRRVLGLDKVMSIVGWLIVGILTSNYVGKQLNS